jgi:hypothetical protein
MRTYFIHNHDFLNLIHLVLWIWLHYSSAQPWLMNWCKNINSKVTQTDLCRKNLLVLLNRNNSKKFKTAKFKMNKLWCNWIRLNIFYLVVTNVHCNQNILRLSSYLAEHFFQVNRHSVDNSSLKRWQHASYILMIKCKKSRLTILGVRLTETWPDVYQEQEQK